VASVQDTLVCDFRNENDQCEEVWVYLYRRGHSPELHVLQFPSFWGRNRSASLLGSVFQALSLKSGAQFWKLIKGYTFSQQASDFELPTVAWLSKWGSCRIVGRNKQFSIVGGLFFKKNHFRGISNWKFEIMNSNILKSKFEQPFQDFKCSLTPSKHPRPFLSFLEFALNWTKIQHFGKFYQIFLNCNYTNSN